MPGVERVGYVGVVVYFVVDKYYVVYSGDLRSIPLDKISKVFSWTPVIYTLAYLIFGSERGLAVSGAFFALLLAAGLPHVLGNLGGEARDASTPSRSSTWPTP